MKKFSIYLFILITFACEKLITVEDTTQNATGSGDFVEALKKLSELENSVGNSLNKFSYLTAISTDEAIESSSNVYHDLLSKQNFTSYNAEIIDSYSLFVNAATLANTVRASFKTLDLEKNLVNYKNLSDTALITQSLYSLSYFYEAFSVYKLASNWDGARIPHLSSENKSSAELNRIAINKLDSARLYLDSLSYEQNSFAESILATTKYFKILSFLNLHNLEANDAYLDSAAFLFTRPDTATTELVRLSISESIGLNVTNSILNEYTQSSSARYLFNPEYFEDDERLSIYLPEKLRLQGSLNTDDSLHLGFDSSRGYLQNKYPQSSFLYHLFNRSKTNALRAEILYKLFVAGKDNVIDTSSGDDEGGNGGSTKVFSTDIAAAINDSRSDNHLRTRPTVELSFFKVHNVTYSKDEIRKMILSEYLATDFLEGRRFETLRRLGIAPYKTTATSETYVYPSSF